MTGPPSSGGAYIKEGFECGRHSLPHRGHEAAEVAPVLDKGFEDGAVHSVMPRINTERVRMLADRPDSQAIASRAERHVMDRIRHLSCSLITAAALSVFLGCGPGSRREVNVGPPSASALVGLWQGHRREVDPPRTQVTAEAEQRLAVSRTTAPAARSPRIWGQGQGARSPCVRLSLH